MKKSHVLVSSVVLALAGARAMANDLGGCCQFDGSCLNDVSESQCLSLHELNFWIKGLPCGQAGGFTCHPRIGACCNGATCQSPVSILDCQCPACEFTAGGDCGSINCAAVPTVSEWGLVITTLLLLSGAKVYYGRS